MQTGKGCESEESMKSRAGGYYGVQKVIYVQISQPAHKGEPQKHFSVYGVSLAKVIEVVDKGLAEAFGKTVSGRPTGRPKGKKKRKKRMPSRRPGSFPSEIRRKKRSRRKAGK